MPTYLGNHLIHKRYENMEAWVEMPSARGASRWVFGYWHSTSHWLGVKIDWVEKSVQVYGRPCATARRSQASFLHLLREAKVCRTRRANQVIAGSLSTTSCLLKLLI